jgi:glycosyltransferase involved in cell wall biosynthesis
MTERKKVCFVVGSIAISGGTYVILQHASYLADHGYDVTLAIQEPFTEATSAWHDQSRKVRCAPIDQARSQTFDLVIATWWKTVFELSTFDAPHFAYFVQSIESRFYPEHERPLRALVDATYRFPISFITEATWIADHLKQMFGQDAALVRNGIRKDIYTPNGVAISPRQPGRPRVLIEGHFNISFKNTAIALDLARQAGAKDIWVMTGSPVRSLPGVSRVFSRVPIHKTPDIYRSCDILVKLSTVEGMFGPPLEMFHCGGTAVVLDVTGHDEYIKHGFNAVVVQNRDTKRVVAELRKLLTEPDYLARLKQGALQTANEWPDWAQSSQMFMQWVNAMLAAPETRREDLAALTQSAWTQYGEDEQSRLKATPSIGWGYRLKSLSRRLPRRVQDQIKQALTIKEALFPPRQIY